MAQRTQRTNKLNVKSVNELAKYSNTWVGKLLARTATHNRTGHQICMIFSLSTIIPSGRQISISTLPSSLEVIQCKPEKTLKYQNIKNVKHL